MDLYLQIALTSLENKAVPARNYIYCKEEGRPCKSSLVVHILVYKIYFSFFS